MTNQILFRETHKCKTISPTQNDLPLPLEKQNNIMNHMNIPSFLYPKFHPKRFSPQITSTLPSDLESFIGTEIHMTQKGPALFTNLPRLSYESSGVRDRKKTLPPANKNIMETSSLFF